MSNNPLDELLQAFVNADYEELVDVAKESIQVVYPYLEKVFKDEDVSEDFSAKVLLHFIYTTFAADGEFTELEYKFYRDLTGTSASYADVKSSMADFEGEDDAALADQLFDEIVDDNDARAALLKLCLAICAVDETISAAEVKFIVRLLK